MTVSTVAAAVVAPSIAVSDIVGVSVIVILILRFTYVLLFIYCC